jgi:hypothetical protein
VQPPIAERISHARGAARKLLVLAWRAVPGLGACPAVSLPVPEPPFWRVASAGLGRLQAAPND